LAGTENTVWSSPIQHPERPWQTAVTCTLPNQMVKGMEVMLTPSSGRIASFAYWAQSGGPKIRTSPGLAALPVVLTPPQLAVLVKTRR
jgi:hypothetical protein